jgi:hypothetical protein
MSEGDASLHYADVAAETTRDLARQSAGHPRAILECTEVGWGGVCVCVCVCAAGHVCTRLCSSTTSWRHQRPAAQMTSYARNA